MVNWNSYKIRGAYFTYISHTYAHYHVTNFLISVEQLFRGYFSTCYRRTFEHAGLSEKN